MSVLCMVVYGCFVDCFFICQFFFFMIRRPPGSTRTDTLLPYKTLFRSTARGEHLGKIQAHALRSADNDGDLARQVELVVAHANLPVNLHFPDWTVGAATIDRKGAACANGDDFPLNAAMEIDRRSPPNETSQGASKGDEGRECSRR